MDFMLLGPLHSVAFASKQSPALPFNPFHSSPASSSMLLGIIKPESFYSGPCLAQARTSSSWSRKLRSKRSFLWRFGGCRLKSCTRMNCRGLFTWRPGLCTEPWMREKGIVRGFRMSPLIRRQARNEGRLVRTRAFNPRGGGDGAGRVVFNLVVAGFLTYLTVTGKLGWLFEAILSIWFFLLLLFWFAERKMIKGPCPNCGIEFQVFEFSLKEEPSLCPYCSQPFKLENKQFVREEPRFSSQQPRGFKQAFGGFGQRSSTPKEQSKSFCAMISGRVLKSTCHIDKTLDQIYLLVSVLFRSVSFLGANYKSLLKKALEGFNSKAILRLACPM